MSSNRDRDRDAADSAPLLGQSEEADTRFAIDEETTIFDLDQEQSQSQQQQSQSSSSSRHKYPPLPPTYQDAIRPNTFLNRHPELNEHLRHFQNRSKEFFQRLPTPFTIWNKTRSTCYRIGCWPENRMVQVGIFLFFLWVLVIVAGPSFEMNDGKGGREQPGKSVWGEDLSASPPPPVSGDGHIVSPAKWEFQSCRTHRIYSRNLSFKSSLSNLNPLKRLWGPPRRVTCSSKTSFDLRVPASFEGTEAVFFYADPERVHAKDRGKIGGNVYIVVDESLPKEEKPNHGQNLKERSHHGHSHTKIKIDIEAKYDRDAQFLLDSTTVTSMGANLWDEGVGIYTWPLPPPFSFRAKDDQPLSFDVTIRIPPGAAVPALKTEVASMEVHSFTKTYSQLTSRSFEDLSTSNNSTNLVPRAQSSSPPSPHFGRFRVETQTGSITSSSIRSISHIKLSSSNGDVKILEKSSLWGPAIRLSTYNGNVLLEDQVSLEARTDVELKTKNGDILSGRNTKIGGAKIIVDCKNGRIGSVYNHKALKEDELGIFKANFTLKMHSSNGNIQANVEIQEPDKRFIINSGPDHRFWVDVEVSSDNGEVDLIYSKHQKGVSLKSNVVAKAAGTVSVKHHKEFEGNWEIDGWKGSKVDKPTSMNEDDGRKRKFEVGEDGDRDGNGAGKKVIKGTIGWDPSSVRIGKEEDGWLPNGGYSKALSNGGVVKMKFD